MKRRNIDPEQAMPIYALVGGRMVLLKFTVDNLNQGFQLDGMYPYSLDNWILTPLF